LRKQKISFGRAIKIKANKGKERKDTVGEGIY
jgi:hypothetical protein